MPNVITPAVEELLKTMDHSPLSETTAALAVIPEPERELIRDYLGHLVSSEFTAAALRYEQAKPDLHRQAKFILNSSKLSALSIAGYLSSMPWHLCSNKPEIAPAIADIILNEGHFSELHGVLREAGAINLFICAQEKDDRDSYLRAARALVSRLPVARVVLDAEIISSHPTDLDEACRQIGISGGYVGASTRAQATEHSYMTYAGLKPVAVDTAGKTVSLATRARSADEISPPPAVLLAGSKSKTPDAPAPDAQPANISPVTEAEPSDSQSRIAMIRERQARRAAAR